MGNYNIQILFIFMYVCVCVYIYIILLKIHTHVQIWINIYTHTYTHTYTEQVLWPCFMDRFKLNQGYRATLQRLSLWFGHPRISATKKFIDDIFWEASCFSLLQNWLQNLCRSFFLFVFVFISLLLMLHCNDFIFQFDLLHCL